MEYHNFVPITADLTGAADAYNQCHYQVSLEFPLKSEWFKKVDIFGVDIFECILEDLRMDWMD